MEQQETKREREVCVFDFGERGVSCFALRQRERAYDGVCVCVCPGGPLFFTRARRGDGANDDARKEESRSGRGRHGGRYFCFSLQSSRAHFRATTETQSPRARHPPPAHALPVLHPPGRRPGPGGRRAAATTGRQRSCPVISDAPAAIHLPHRLESHGGTGRHPAPAPQAGGAGPWGRGGEWTGRSEAGLGV